jgi:hypothetical protein
MGGRHEATRGRRHEATRGGRHEATRGRDEVAVSGCTLSQSDSKKASCHIERVGFSQVQLVSVGFSQVQLVSVGFSWFQLVSVGFSWSRAASQALSVGWGRLRRRCRSVGGGFAGAVGRLGAASQALVPIPPSVAAALQSRGFSLPLAQSLGAALQSRSAFQSWSAFQSKARGPVHSGIQSGMWADGGRPSVARSAARAASRRARAPAPVLWDWCCS